MNAPPTAAALARVPGLEDGQPALRIEVLGGGTVNRVYRVDSLQGRFILRLDGAAWRRPGVDRSRELSLHQVAAAGGIAPLVVAAAPEEQGLLITEFQDGRLWRPQDYRDPLALQRLGERLYRLHRLSPPPIEAFDPLRVGQDYARLVSAAHSAAAANALERLQTACRDLTQGYRPPTVVHGDLWEGNLLQGEQLWLLDWEYAQLTDPLMDIACLLAYYPQSAPHQNELLAAAGFDARVHRPALMARIDIYRMLSWLWHLARGEAVDPP
jgi:thiamine kinase-like enzyme